MTKTLILGLQWGDEGKGKIVDLLSDKMDAVVRFQGGNNAGHTLVIDGTRIALHLIPSGVMRDKVQCFIGNGVVLDCKVLLKELEGLKAHQVNVENRFFISESCHLILPTHIALDGARELARGDKAIGTTKRGIGPAYEDKVARRGLRFIDLFSADFPRKLKALVKYHNTLLRNYYQTGTFSYQEILDDCLRYADILKPFLCDVTQALHDLAKQGKNILFEGAQGVLLDIDHGTYPFVTSSNTTMGAVATGSGFPANKLDTVLGVAKAYTTRVGEGPFPTALQDGIGDGLATRGHEFGTTTGRARQCGWFDAVLTKRAVDLNGVTSLCVTKLDVLDGMETLKICVAYDTPEGKLTEPRMQADQLAESKPIYEEMPGWQESTVGVREYDALPDAAKKYLSRLAELLGVSVDMISTSPERLDTITLSNL